MKINEKYYDGFEGEPEITFCLKEKGVIVEKIGVWDGYFNEIMKVIRPEEGGWTGLAYYYQLYAGWYEQDNWLIPNISEVYKQMASINPDELMNAEEKEVLILITDLLKRAIDNSGEVYIVYD